MYVKECAKDLERIGGRQGRGEFLRLDMNENPGGLPLEFVEKVKRELTPEYLATYPEESLFLKLLSGYLGIAPENLCLTNGSDMAIRYLFEVFARPGAAVVTVAPSFEMYKVNSWIFGLKHRPVKYSPDYTVDISKILESVQDDTDIVVLLNPNNPIGSVFTEEEFESVVRRADEVGALVIVDEAYHYFYEKTFLARALAHDNVALLRTFSKLMSIAGCRLGFIVSNPRIAGYVRNVRPTFEVNGVALKFAEMILKEDGLIERLAEIEKDGRKVLLDSLERHHYEYIAKQGNFIFVKPKTSVAQVLKGLEERKILVKDYGHPLLKQHIRVSTGAREYMERFLAAFYEVDL